jgi:poly(A) polymerase
LDNIGHHEPEVSARVRELCPDAAKVVSRMNRYGFISYLCGGSVRDMLLGLKPKDFDLVTDATPRQVKRLFRNSRIIGRRFRLVQVIFSDRILEVSTFRSAAEKDDDGSGDLLIHHDNVFGTPEEDAVRRDFTINGLFYDLGTERVLDYVGGLADLDRRVIATIGDPWIRFREDPVRMLRAIKFAARIDFRLSDDVYEAIIDCRHEIDRAAPARLFEEIMRLMNLGGACESVRLLFRTGLLANLIPELDAALHDFASRGDQGPWTAFWATLREFDAAVRAGERATNARMIAALFAPLFEKEMQGHVRNGRPPDEDGLTPVALKFRMARRDLFDARRILFSQRRFFPPDARRPKMRIEHLRAREGFDDCWFFFGLRSRALGGPVLEEFESLRGRLEEPAPRG